MLLYRTFNFYCKITSHYVFTISMHVKFKVQQELVVFHKAKTKQKYRIKHVKHTQRQTHTPKSTKWSLFNYSEDQKTEHLNNGNIQLLNVCKFNIQAMT